MVLTALLRESRGKFAFLKGIPIVREDSQHRKANAITWKYLTNTLFIYFCEEFAILSRFNRFGQCRRKKQRREDWIPCFRFHSAFS